MRVRRLPDAVGSYARRFGIRHRTAYPLITGIIAVVPALVAGGGTLGWLGGSGDHTRDAALGQGYDPGHAALQQIAVDGTRPTNFPTARSASRPPRSPRTRPPPTSSAASCPPATSTGP